VRIRRVITICVALLFSVLTIGLGAAPASADSSPAIDVGDVTMARTTSGITNFVFPVTLEYASNNTVTVNYFTSDSSARANVDYTPEVGSLSFGPGVVSKTVTVPVIGSTLHKGNLAFNLQLSGSTNATVNHGTGTGTIIDPTLNPYVNLGNTNVTEGAGNAAVATFTATLSTASANPVTFRYTTSDGTARAGIDYTAKSGFVTMAPGQVTASITVPVLAMSVAAPYRYFFVNLGNPVNVTLGNTQGVATILNSNHTAFFTVDDTAVTASTSTTGTLNFAVRLASPATFPVTVDYGTSDGSATAAANDYVPAFGTLTFAPGTTVQTVPVTVGTQLASAVTKFMALSISGASTGGSVLRATGTGTIGGPTTGYHQLEVGDVGLVRGTSGTNPLAFTVNLSPAAASTVTVHFSTQDNSAVAPGDYTSASGTLTFAAGQTSQTATINVVGNTTTFVDKNFLLNLSAATGATLERGQAFGEISNGNLQPVVSVGSVALVKPASGTATAAFTVRLSSASPNPVTVHTQTSDGNATSAGGDYVSATGTVTIPAGQVTGTANVTVNGSTVAGPNLFFNLTISAPTDAVLAVLNTGTAFIANPNHAPTLSVNNVAVYAPLTGTATSNFTVSLSSASTQTVTVHYATSDDSATVVGGDYTSASGTLTFAPGTVSKTIPVTIGGTTIAHPSRNFFISLSSATNAAIVSSTGLDTILDDAVAPYISADNPSVPSGPSATTMTYTVSLSSASANPITVHYVTSDGSAVSGSQYTGTTGNLTFAPGVVTQTVPVTILPATVKITDRFFFLNLSAPTNALLASPSSGEGFILNTAVQPGITVGDVTIARPTSGTASEVFTLTLAPASLNTVTVNFATSDDTAHAPTDYTTTVGSATFTPGTTTQTVTVPIKSNAASTTDLNYFLNLSAAVNAQLLRTSAIGTLVDQVAPVVGKSYVTVSDAVVTVPSSGTATAAFSVSLALPATAPVYVRYSTGDNSAVAGIDYTAAHGTLQFAAGQTKKTVNVTVNGSSTSALDRNFSLSITIVSGPGTVERFNGSAYLLNPNPTALVGVAGPVVVIKGDSGTTNAVFTVQLSAAQAQTVQVDFTTFDSSATVAGGDYQQAIGTLVFAPGQTTQTVSVVVNSNTLPKLTTSYGLELTTPVGLVIGNQSSTGYILDPDVFTVTGSVVDPSGAAVAGATITRTGNNQPTATATSAANGTFSLPNTLNGKYTLTPTLAGKVFLPATLAVTVRGAAVANEVFIAYAGSAITGQTTVSAGAADAGVTVTRTGGGQATATATTDVLGYYVFGSLPNGTNYVVTPTKTGQVANPASLTSTIAGATVAKQDFVMVTAPFIIGRVVTAGVGVAGVTVTLTGGTQPSVKVVTDSLGYYGFSAVAASVSGTTYTVTPTATGHTFTPVSLNATVSTTANATGINFTES
jgi:hypothetical protein